MNKQNFCFIIILICCLFSNILTAQENNNQISAKDSSSSILLKEKTNHSPKKAAWMSAVLPGLGQGYNHKYWKIPIVYAGFGGAGFGVYWFNKNFVYYRNEYKNRLNGKTDALNSDLSSWNDENVNAMRTYYLRYLELSIIVTVIWYAVNIVDAVVDAHLFNFDVSDDLSLNIRPNMSVNYMMGKYNICNEIAFTLKF